MGAEMTLAELPPGGRGVIVQIRGSSPFMRRLLEMGLIRGEVVEKVKLAPLADPAEYIVKGYHISLRRAEAGDSVVNIQ